jgi:hypothetical protein
MSVNAVDQKCDTDQAGQYSSGVARLDLPADFADHSNSEKGDACQNEDIRQRRINKMSYQVSHISPQILPRECLELDQFPERVAQQEAALKCTQFGFSFPVLK